MLVWRDKTRWLIRSSHHRFNETLWLFNRTSMTTFCLSRFVNDHENDFWLFAVLEFMVTCRHLLAAHCGTSHMFITIQLEGRIGIYGKNSILEFSVLLRPVGSWKTLKECSDEVVWSTNFCLNRLPSISSSKSFRMTTGGTGSRSFVDLVDSIKIQMKLNLLWKFDQKNLGFERKKQTRAPTMFWRTLEACVELQSTSLIDH